MQDSPMELPEEPGTPEAQSAEPPTSPSLPEPDPGLVATNWPAPATVPLATPDAPPPGAWVPEYTPYPAYAPYPAYPSYGPYGAYGNDTAPTIQSGQSARPRGPRWTYALVALALLVALLIGGGIGAAITSARNSSGRSVTLGAQSAPGIPVPSNASSLQQTVENIVHTVQPSVVEITSTSDRQQAIGSGDILTPDGYIVTNDHVVQGFGTFNVKLASGSTVSAQLVGQDPQDDLAVIKIGANNLHPIAIGDSAKAQTGEFAIVVGTPLGLAQSATFGIVSALNRSASEAPQGPADELTGLIQTSAPINPGNSGGALVNLQGQLIGIPTLNAIDPETGAAANGIGYAIPSNRVSYVAGQLIQHGQLTTTGQGFLGIQVQDVTPEVAAADGLSVQSGELITSFVHDASGRSPAQRAGLHVGDVITAVDGQTITGNGDLPSYLLNLPPGTQVSVTVERGTRQLTIQITLGARPANVQG